MRDQSSRSPDVTTVTRSEEALRVETHKTPVGRVRVTTRIVTEDVTRTFQLRHETLHVERLPASGQDPEPPAGQDDPDNIEIVLHREELQVAKTIVPYERVRVTKHVVTDNEAVATTLRKEQLEVTEHRHPEPL